MPLARRSIVPIAMLLSAMCVVGCQSDRNAQASKAPPTDADAAAQRALTEALASAPEPDAESPPPGYNTAVNDYFKRLGARAQEQPSPAKDGSR